jgi:hypothetical protein
MICEPIVVAVVLFDESSVTTLSALPNVVPLAAVEFVFVKIARHVPLYGAEHAPDDAAGILPVAPASNSTVPLENDALVTVEAVRARTWPLIHGNDHVPIDAALDKVVARPVGDSYVPWTIAVVEDTDAITGDARDTSVDVHEKPPPTKFFSALS